MSLVALNDAAIFKLGGLEEHQCYSRIATFSFRCVRSAILSNISHHLTRFIVKIAFMNKNFITFIDFSNNKNVPKFITHPQSQASGERSVAFFVRCTSESGQTTE